jgi:hypothetical protein
VRGRTGAEIAAPALATHLLSFATAIAAGAVAHAASRRRASPSPVLQDDHA